MTSYVLTISAFLSLITLVVTFTYGYGCNGTGMESDAKAFADALAFGIFLR